MLIKEMIEYNFDKMQSHIKDNLELKIKKTGLMMVIIVKTKFWLITTSHTVSFMDKIKLKYVDELI